MQNFIPEVDDLNNPGVWRPLDQIATESVCGRMLDNLDESILKDLFLGVAVIYRKISNIKLLNSLPNATI